MSRVNGVSYTNVLLAFDLEGNGQFNTFCSINGDKALTLTNTFVESILPDCENHEAPDIPEHTVDARSATFSGSGKIHANDLNTFADFHMTGAKVACKASVGKPGNGFTLTGQVVFESFEFNSSRKQFADGSLSGMFTGDYVKAAIPAA